MAISIGKTMPSVTLFEMGEEGPEPVSTDDLFAGKKVAVFGAPGVYPNSPSICPALFRMPMH